MERAATVLMRRRAEPLILKMERAATVLMRRRAEPLIPE
jgi:hypothetical protein